VLLLLLCCCSTVPEELVEEIGDLAVVENDDAGYVPHGAKTANHSLISINLSKSTITLFLVSCVG
jgi:hypothetical protein